MPRRLLIRRAGCPADEKAVRHVPCGRVAVEAAVIWAGSGISASKAASSASMASAPPARSPNVCKKFDIDTARVGPAHQPPHRSLRPCAAAGQRQETGSAAARSRPARRSCCCQAHIRARCCARRQCGCPQSPPPRQLWARAPVPAKRIRRARHRQWAARPAEPPATGQPALSERACYPPPPAKPRLLRPPAWCWHPRAAGAGFHSAFALLRPSDRLWPRVARWTCPGFVEG